MLSRIEYGKHVLEGRKESSKGWMTVQSLGGVKLGNFAWKRKRHILKRILPAFAKYSYEATHETLEEYLQGDEGGVKFKFRCDTSSESLPTKTYDKKQGVYLKVISSITGNADQSHHAKIPATELTITRINRKDLEDNLKLRKLNMDSSYIKVKKNKTAIPCIISEIVEAATYEDQADQMAVVETRRQIGGDLKLQSNVVPSDVLDSVQVGGTYETCEKTEAVINGLVLYKVLPLEVDPTGRIDAKEDSKGFLEDKVVDDSASGNFSSTMPDPTLPESFNEIEKLLRPVMEDKSVADAFKSISNEDIYYLCRLFERVQDCPDDVEEPDKMSSECRTILLFAKFQPQEPDKLVLKERFQDDHSFTSCYYLAAVLAEVPTPVRQLFDQTTVNLFPLLKDILLVRPLKDIEINDDILKCNEAKALLERLEVCTKGSTVDAAPASQALLVNAVWIAMLYGWHSRKEQQ